MCEKYGVDFCPSPTNLVVGIARNVKEKLIPLNGLRHPVEGESTGWYIWAGEELSSNPEFFEPVHVVHLSDWCPNAIDYLGLPPGWRFLIDGDYEDVWFDPTLLNI